MRPGMGGAHDLRSAPAISRAAVGPAIAPLRAESEGRPALATITVGSKMTRSPLTIEASAPLSSAHALMRARRIRHLPVTEGGRLRGVVSLRDLHLIETLPGVKQGEVRVSEAMTTDPYAVSRAAPLAKVAATMAARKLGCAIVMDGDAIAGVFTNTDGMKLLATLLSAPRRAKARR